MNLETNATLNESMPTTVAVESNPQPSDQKLKLFSVPVIADVRLTLNGEVEVYALDAEEAADKVQAQIDDGTLDDDLEMEDYETGTTMSYGDVTSQYDRTIEVDEHSIDVIEDDVDPAEVLEVEVKELQGSISWDAEKLSKNKAFLESLLDDNGDDDQIALAA